MSVIIKKIPYRLVYRQLDGGICQMSFFFPGNSRMYQVDLKKKKRLARQRDNGGNGEEESGVYLIQTH